MREGREYEIKFQIEPSACEALPSHPVLDAALRHRRLSHLTSTYYDTHDDRLRQDRVSLRVRLGEVGAVQTLKRVGGSHVDREEWERASDGSAPDMTWLRATPLKELFEQLDSPLAPRFTVDVTRTTYPLERDAGCVEAALDRGEIRADRLALPVSELELESKAGRRGAVFDVARDLVRDLPLTLSLASKAERGFAVIDDDWSRPVKAIDLRLDGDETRQQVFEAIVQACLHALTRNAGLIKDDASGDAVHKTRIALRRLRAALDLFKPSLRRERTKGLRRDIKWIARKLGDARDADVLQADFIEPAMRDPLVTGAPALASLMAERRAQAHRALRAALATPRWRLLLVELLVLSIDGVRRSQRDRGFRRFVRGRLASRHEALAERTRGFAHLSPRAMHDVRKAGKALRYDLDLFEKVPKLGSRGKAYARLQAHLAALQELLGQVQDGATLRARLRDIIRRPPVVASAEMWRSAASAARLLDQRSAGDADMMRRAAKAARKLRGTIVFG